ncbi:MAG: heme o synthase [Armatimonadetes bacterium]|nr:heme o synthase [Armatimonadota bacterium]
MSTTRFARFAWFTLIFNFVVIAWGALVRATNSGDGCSNHWPLCDGQIIPAPHKVKTVIEFTHRVMSGLDGILILALLIFAFKAFPQKHRVRYGAVLCLVFTFIEAMIGRLLVKKGLVAENISVERAVWLAGHLVNTFFLLGSLTITAIWSTGVRPLRWKKQGAMGWALGFSLFSLLALGVSGAITALGDTKFPVHSTYEAMQGALNPTAHFLIRLRVIHPFLAVSVGLYLLLIAGLTTHLRPSPLVRKYAQYTGLAFALQIAIGLINKTLHAPVSMQLVHLLFADIVWTLTILLTTAALAEDVVQVETDPLHYPEIHSAVGRATWRDYLVLTKPRVISLLLFTTMTAMFIAPQTPDNHVTPLLFFIVMVAGYMVAGAANAINMVIDRDIDGRMKRTSERPTVTQKISSLNALYFAFSLATLSFSMFWTFANLLSAVLGFAGLVFYVLIYTLILKRRTWHNIVIGGAAGAFPPLVGWAAVTNDLAPLAWYLFAIIFVWTPVHFWALALLLKDDYTEAGIPMLPSVLGDRVTVAQIGMYTVLTAVVSILPFLQKHVGILYLCSAIILNLILALRSLQLYRTVDRPRASSLFHFSMLYLALLFLFMAIDRSLHL